MCEIKDKVFFITGGATGIGAGVARAVLKKGAKHVAILDVNETEGKAFETELNNKYGKIKVKFIKCDVTTELDAAFDTALKEFGYIDVVMNNAGTMIDAPHGYVKMININVTALITSSLKAYNLMHKERGGKGGTIINIASIVGLFQTPVLPIYSATKSAVLQFSNCLGKEPNFTRTGVRVITMCFGCTDTSLLRNPAQPFDEELKDDLTDAINQLPLQTIESAAQGVLDAFENGDSGSTWLATSNRPVKDITQNVHKAYEILQQGLFE